MAAAPRGMRRVAVLCLALFALCAWAPRAEAKGAAARSAASSSGAVTLQILPDRLSPAAVQNSSSAVLGNITFRCADVKIFRPGVDVRVKNGNGFMRIDPIQVGNIGPNISAQLAAQPMGGAVNMVPSLATDLGGLDGANAVFMSWLANQGNFDVSVDVINVPPQLLAAGDWTDIYNYALTNLSYDCVISPVIMDAERTASMNFVTPHQPYGYTVVAPSGVYVPKTVAQVLFAWTDPFQPSIWACTAACLVFSTVIMYIIESKHNEDDFGLQEYNLLVRIGRGLFRALSNFCAVGSFSPVTPAGQTFTISFSFAMILVQSAYTANLAAYFTRNRSTQQTVAGIYSFAQYNLPVCVTRDIVLMSLMQNNFPTVRIIPIDGGPFTVLNAVNNGTCAGAVMVDADANYVLGIGDTEGSYCKLADVGNNLNTGFIGFAFSKSLSTSVIKAINDIVIDGISLGTYGSLTAGYFSTDRTTGSCATYLSQQAALAAGSDNSLAPLSFNQLAGIFFVLVLGAGASLVVYIVFDTAKRSKARRLAAQGVNTVNDFTAEAEGPAKTILSDPLSGDESRYQGNKGSLNTFSGRNGLINANPMLDFQPRPGEQPIQTTFRLLVSQIRDDVARDMFRVPEALLHSSKRALANGMYVRARAEVVDGNGNIVGDVNIEGSSVGQMCMLHGLMTPEEAAQFQRLVVEILRASEARGRRPPGPNGPQGSYPQQNGNGGLPPRANGRGRQQQPQTTSFVDGLMASVGLGNPEWRRDQRPPRGDPYGRNGAGGPPGVPPGTGKSSSDKNLQNLAASPLVGEPLRPFRQGTMGTGIGAEDSPPNGYGRGSQYAQSPPRAGSNGNMMAYP